MTRRLLLSLLVAVVVSGGTTTVASSTPAHRFELLSAAVAEPGDTSVHSSGTVTCLYGRHDPGEPVLLLSKTDSTTCTVVTGRVGRHIRDGECTVLKGLERCEGSYEIGVIGARGGYRQIDLAKVVDEPTRRALGRVIVKDRVAESASRRWKDLLSELTIEAVVDDAFSWPGRSDAPTLVRLKISGEDVGGPIVAVSRGKSGTIAGPFAYRPPTAFTLDGVNYVRLDVAVCTRCGGVGTEIHAVEAGKLKLVLTSFAGAN